MRWDTGILLSAHQYRIRQKKLGEHEKKTRIKRIIPICTRDVTMNTNSLKKHLTGPKN